jgi:hypothetical protein
MRKRDYIRPADKDGLYGCCHCGTYTVRREGEDLSCPHCRTARPMVYVDEWRGANPVRADPRDQRTDPAGAGNHVNTRPVL